MSSTFGQRLKAIVLFYDLTQADLANRTGLSQNNISHLIAGRREPTLKTLAKIIYALPNCDIGWLVCGEIWWSGNKQATESEMVRAFRELNDANRAANKLAKNEKRKSS